MSDDPVPPPPPTPRGPLIEFVHECSERCGYSLCITFSYCSVKTSISEDFFTRDVLTLTQGLGGRYPKLLASKFDQIEHLSF